MRAVYAYVPHKIKRHPTSQLTVTATCLASDCTWQVGPTSDGELVDNACMAHTGLNATHTTFDRAFKDVAEVVRLEHNERSVEGEQPRESTIPS